MRVLVHCFQKHIIFFFFIWLQWYK